jgi:glycerophosphoryl diester phosphodiesterase
MEGRILALLKEFGYEKKSDPAIIQCFEADSLKLIRSEFKSDLHLSYLTGSLADYLAQGGAAGIAQFADSVAPNKGAALMNNAQIIREAKAASLPVIVWTLYDNEAEYQAFMKEHRVFGLFTDYPDIGVKIRG